MGFSSPVRTRSRPSGFTLVELLVVVSIIVLLVSILTPSLARTREFTRRATCGSNQRQILTGAIGHATDHEGKFPRTHRNGPTSTGTDHTSWTSQVVLEDFLERRGINLTEFVCPNLGLDFIRQVGSRYRIGYYLQFGRDMDLWTDEFDPWESPQGTFERTNLVAVTDINETGTFTPPTSRGTHGPNGSIIVWEDARPIDFGVEGGNVTRIDGSAVWTPANLFELYAASSGGLVLGYW